MRFFVGGPRLFGLRTGVLFGARDLGSLLGGTAGEGPASAAGDSALYVVTGEHRRCKIGITGNTEQRLSQLRTGSAYPIDYAWIGIPERDAAAIESDALTMLDPYRTHRDWFDITPDAAVGAISAAAHRRGVQVLPVTPAMAETIRLATAAQQARTTASFDDRLVRFLARHLWRLLGGLFRTVVTLAAVALVIGAIALIVMIATTPNLPT